MGEIFGIKYATNPSEVIEVSLADRIPPTPVLSKNIDEMITNNNTIKLQWEAATTYGAVLEPEYAVYMGKDKKASKKIAKGLKDKEYVINSITDDGKYFIKISSKGTDTKEVFGNIVSFTLDRIMSKGSISGMKAAYTPNESALIEVKASDNVKLDRIYFVITDENSKTKYLSKEIKAVKDEFEMNVEIPLKKLAPGKYEYFYYVKDSAGNMDEKGTARGKFIVYEDNNELVLIKKGATKKENGNIKISKDFFIGRYEITQKEFKKIMNYNPSEFDSNENKPVENVSWYDAVVYCNKRSEKEGLTPYYIVNDIVRPGNSIISADVKINGGTGYRLPVDKEWEYAARGGEKGKGYIYSGSNDINQVAWYLRNTGDEDGETKTVGLKKWNELGIYDMSGNVNEWTETGYSEKSKIFCGGGWNKDETKAVVSSKDYAEPSYTFSNIGFRIARSSE